METVTTAAWSVTQSPAKKASHIPTTLEAKGGRGGYNVEGLCRELPTRVESLYDAEGGKLQK